MRKNFLLSGSLLALAALGSTLDAAPITVPNFSFEDGGTSIAVNDQSVPGWSFAGDDYDGVQSQLNGPRNPTGTDGSYFAFVNLSNGNANPHGSITSDAPVTTITPSTIYNLTIAVGSNATDAGYHIPGDFSISLLANGLPVATSTLAGSTIPDGTLVDLSTTFTSPATGDVDGEDLTILMSSTSNDTNASGGGEQSLFDNVRLDATAVPEPASLGIAGIFSIALLGSRRRRRI